MNRRVPEEWSTPHHPETMVGIGSLQFRYLCVSFAVFNILRYQHFKFLPLKMQRCISK